MRVLFLGDIVGKSGRIKIQECLQEYKNTNKIDFVIANGENATSGAGLSSAHAEKILEHGVDCITLGDHAFDQNDIQKIINDNHKIIRPLNYSEDSPGKGFNFFNCKSKKILVVQVLGRVFMKKKFSDPFPLLNTILDNYKLGRKADCIIVDVHAEATSEKMAVGYFCDGRASLVVGTHTHIPTADTRILPSGTAYQTDAGMCGDYDSIIGMDKAEPMRRFVKNQVSGRFVPASGDATLCGIQVEINDLGLAERVKPVRFGGLLNLRSPEQ